jgi:hypothetical protein
LSERIPGRVESVVNPAAPTPETKWYIDSFGSGIMVNGAVHGSLFTSEQSDELSFVGRDTAAPDE